MIPETVKLLKTYEDPITGEIRYKTVRCLEDAHVERQPSSDFVQPTIERPESFGSWS